MDFQNTTVYIVPVWFDDLGRFSKALLADGRWDLIAPERMATKYLVSYVAHIVGDPRRFRAFSLRGAETLRPHMFGHVFEKPHCEARPQIREVRFSCFGTGVGFLEFFVTYSDGIPIEVIADFAYNFKKAAKSDTSYYRHGDGLPSLYRVIGSILPEGSGAEPFFAGTSDLKYECQCFHMIRTEETDSARLDRYVRLLKRSYNQSFECAACDESRYDMTYAPYSYDRWGGSQEALVNLVHPTGVEESDRFIRNYKYDHLTVDYRFMYLILLNQRFSAIRYVGQIAEANDGKGNDPDRLGKRIVALKTAYAFRVVSDDLIYQNVYYRMYDLLDIDNLLADLQDNEEQISLLRNARAARAEQSAGRLLFVISVLSIFSVLIDAASYLERFEWIGAYATPLSGVIVFGISLGYAIYYFCRRRK